MNSEKKSLSNEYDTIKKNEFAKLVDFEKLGGFKLIYEEYKDMVNNEDKLRALSAIRTQFRSLIDISGTERNISATGTSLEQFINSKKPTILLFSLDTTAKKIQSQQIARMLISDVKQNERSIRKIKKDNSLMCIFDEFGSFATDDIAELQEQGRSFGFQIIYAIQTLANLTKIGKDFCSRIVGNCSTYVTHKTKENEAAEEIANLIGTNPAFEGTERESAGEFTGEKSIREVDHYIHHPRLIKQLDDFHALIVTVKDGRITPIKEPIKIDYADIKNFRVKKPEKISREMSLYIVELVKQGFSQKRAEKIARKEFLESKM